MKIENSEPLSQEQCDIANESHKRLGFEFEIKPEDTTENEGLRALAKLCLNSLWGKFGQRKNLSNYDFYYEYNKLLLKMHDSNTQNKTWHIVNNNCVELRYEEDDDIKIEADYISEITAVFTTANARMRLYDMLDWLDPSQILYYDTDSVFFIYNKKNPKHKKPENSDINPKTIRFGNALGDWKDEHDKTWITEMALGGAKSYGYITNDKHIDIKQKGITMDRNNTEIVNLDSYRNMVLNHVPIKTPKRHQFRWSDTTKDIITKFIDRSIRSTINEKRKPIGYDTYPFGYHI
jgi:hypothetical protein